MSEHIDAALENLRWAEHDQGKDEANHHLKAAHVHAMLAVAQEVADLHQSIGAYLETLTYPPRVVGDKLVFGKPDPIAYREGDRIRHKDGHGYGDMVNDEQIEENIRLAKQNGENFPGFIEFAEAVLKLRAFERAVK